MKRITSLLLICMGVIATISCDKTVDDLINPKSPDGYQEYVIREGQQYSTIQIPTEYKSNKLKFKVIFDSTAIYTTKDPDNQDDINKLYGFSDCGQAHHTESARFGWRWSNDSLRLFAYVYLHTQLMFQELGVVSLGEEHSCEIAVKGSTYVFSLNNLKMEMPRGCDSDSSGAKYRLYPFFGGNETAPHDIHIKIKEEKD